MFSNICLQLSHDIFVNFWRSFDGCEMWTLSCHHRLWLGLRRLRLNFGLIDVAALRIVEVIGASAVLYHGNLLRITGLFLTLFLVLVRTTFLFPFVIIVYISSSSSSTSSHGTLPSLLRCLLLIILIVIHLVFHNSLIQQLVKISAALF